MRNAQMLVKGALGGVLSDSEVRHFYTTADGLTERLGLGEAERRRLSIGPSSAFARS